jgi:hypothetical protein
MEQAHVMSLSEHEGLPLPLIPRLVRGTGVLGCFAAATVASAVLRARPTTCSMRWVLEDPALVSCRPPYFDTQ